MSTKESDTDSGSEREEEATASLYETPIVVAQRAKEMVVRRSDDAPSLRCPPPLCPESNCFNRLNLDMFSTFLFD